MSRQYIMIKCNVYEYNKKNNIKNFTLNIVVFILFNCIFSLHKKLHFPEVHYGQESFLILSRALR